MKIVSLLITFSLLSVYLFGQQPTVKDSVRQFPKQGIIVLNSGEASAETRTSDSIVMETKITQNTYYYKDKKLTYSIVKKILITNEEAAEYVGFANTHRIVSDVFLGSGIIAVCFSGIYAIDREDPAFFYKGAIVGGAMIVISIPFQILFTRNMHKSIDIFNRDLNLANNRTDLNLQMTSSGIGLVLKF